MIVVRNIFRLQFGKAREALELFREMRASLQEGSGDMRILVDVAADFYTVVLETTAADLAEWETSMSAMSDENLQKLYARLTPLVIEGRREIFRIVE